MSSFEAVSIRAVPLLDPSCCTLQYTRHVAGVSACLLHQACSHALDIQMLPNLQHQCNYDSTTYIPAEPVQEAQGQNTQESAQAHAEHMQQLQAAHEEELKSVQQAAQQAQADMQAAHAAESNIVKEAHAADLSRLRALQDALPQQLMQLQSAGHRPSSDLSPSELGAC